MVESWIGSMGVLLPRAISAAGHEFSFVTRDLNHYLRSPSGPGTHPLLGARNIFTTETNDVKALVTTLRPLHKALGFDGVLSSCDYYLPAVAAVAQDLGLPGGADAKVVAACRKDHARQVLAVAGVPGPRYAVATEWTEIQYAALEIGFPLVVKPVDLCAGMFVRRADDVAQLREAVNGVQALPVNARGQRRQPQVLLEEYLAGPEFSVETVTWAGRTTVLGITDKSLAGEPWFIETGHMFPAAISPTQAESIATVARSALEVLGITHAVAHTEVRLTAAGPKVVEINPRPGGNQITELVRRVTGVNLTKAYVQIALGSEPDLSSSETGVGSAAVGFLLPPGAGLISQISGISALEIDPAVVEHTIPDEPRRASSAENNNCYLGYVMTVDARPGWARAAAERLISQFVVEFAEECAPA